MIEQTSEMEDDKRYWSVNLSVPKKSWSFELEDQLKTAIKLVGGIFGSSGVGFGFRDLEWEAYDKHTAMTVYFFIVNFLADRKIFDNVSVFVEYWNGTEWEDILQND